MSRFLDLVIIVVTDKRCQTKQLLYPLCMLTSNNQDRKAYPGNIQTGGLGPDLYTNHPK